jgi:OOP family OmpA-OmpF porin
MNKLLSRDRAKEVSEELKKNGIPGKKIMYFGRGQINPIADNNTKNGRIQNRRVEITVK